MCRLIINRHGKERTQLIFPAISHVVKCFCDKICQLFCIFILKYSKNQQLFLTKMFTKWLKNFRWMNTRVGKGFFEEKMANLKVFLRNLAKHIVDSTFIFRKTA